MLREQDWGAWAGRRVEDLLREIPDLAARYATAGWNFHPPDGESRESVRRRSVDALCRAAARRPGEKILVVTHAGTIRCLINGLMGRRFLPSDPPILWSGFLHRLLHERESLRVDRLNAVDLDARRPARPPTDEADFITIDVK
jgi:probable phosphoglycerate mutase